MELKYTEFGISTNAILKIVVTGLVLWFLWAIRDVLMLVLIAVTLASALDPLVERLRISGIPRIVTVLVVYVLALFLLVAMGYLFVRPVVMQIAQIASNPQPIIDNLQQQLHITAFNDLNIGQGIANIFHSIETQMTTLSGTFYERTLGVFNGAVDVITIIVISFYLVAEPTGMRGLVEAVVPKEHQHKTLHVVTKIQHKIGRWLIGQFIISATVFALVLIGLTLFGIKYALVLAILAGFLEFIPYLGPFLFAIPGIFFTFIESPALVIPVALMYLLIQKTEGYVLVPKVMQKSIGVSPLVIMLAVIIGLKVAGIFGVFLAVPVVAAVHVVITEWKAEPMPETAEHTEIAPI